MTAAYCSECGKRLSAKNKSGLCRSHSMAARIKVLNADPEFAALKKARNSAWMKALHADPEFAARNSARMKALNADPEFAALKKARNSAWMKALRADPARNPLVLLTAKERADYDRFKRAGYTRGAAFRSIGRADLAGEAAE